MKLTDHNRVDFDEGEHVGHTGSPDGQYFAIPAPVAKAYDAVVEAARAQRAYRRFNGPMPLTGVDDALAALDKGVGDGDS